jgi:flagellar assembly protein FliH
VVDLRAGTWTRLGASTVLGDSATEATLDALADRARAAGMAQGYAAGWAEGRRRAQEASDQAAAERAAADQQAAAQLRADQQALVTSLGDAVARCDAVLAERQELLATEAVDLGLRIAEAILGRELATMTDAGAEALRRALAQVPPTVTATVRLSPADAAALDPAEIAGRPVTVVADPSVAAGGAVLETDVSTVDAGLETALARVREALGR